MSVDKNIISAWKELCKGDEVQVRPMVRRPSVLLLPIFCHNKAPGFVVLNNTCTGYLEHPFKHLVVSSVIDLELLGKLNLTLTGLRTDLPMGQHRMSLSMCRAARPLTLACGTRGLRLPADWSFTSPL